MLFLKFGKKEHLEQLKSGIFHFRPLNEFVKDPTNFRGDRLEGKLLLPKGSPLLINGFDISEYIQEATITNEGFEKILSISFAMLDLSNCHPIGNGIFAPNRDVIKTMQAFGTHFLLLNPMEVRNAIFQTLENHCCYYKCQPILYCDKSDSKLISQHFIETKGHISDYDYFGFTKPNDYKNQNEYRFIIDDYENEFPIETSGGVNLKTGFYTDMPICEVSSLSTLKASRDYLE